MRIQSVPGLCSTILLLSPGPASGRRGLGTNLVYPTMLVIVTLALVSFFLSTHGQSLSWQLLPATGVRPSARRYSAVTWTPTSALYVFGGQTVDGSVLDDTWMYSMFSNTWEQLVNLVERPPARYGFVSGVIGNCWYITHGRNQSSVFDDTWSFCFQDKEWTLVNTTGSSSPQARYFSVGGCPASGSLTGPLWLAMGRNGVGRNLGDSWVLTINATRPGTGEWGLVSAGVGLNQYDPTLPHARYLSAGLPVRSDRLIISGGCASGGQAGGPCPLDDTWLLHRSNGSWQQLTSCSLPRYSSSLASLHQQLSDIGVIIGGDFRGPGLIPQVSLGGDYRSRELVIVNITSQNWAKVTVTNTTNLPPALSSPHVVAGGPGVFMFGGEKLDDNSLTNNVWLLTGTSAGSRQLPCTAEVFSVLHLHGIIMFIAWGLLLPFGALLGRYYRWSWPVWFILHIICQVCGTFLTVCGVVLAFLISSEPSFPHAVIGIVLTLIVLQQFLSGIFRQWSKQHDDGSREHYEYPKNQSNTSKWRQCQRVYHGVSGSIAIAIGFAQVTLGVLLIVAPPVVWATWVGLLGTWIMGFVLHEVIHYTRTHCCKRYDI